MYVIFVTLNNESEPSICCAGEPRRWKVHCLVSVIADCYIVCSRSFAVKRLPGAYPMPQLFGSKLAYLRAQHGLTQAELARQLRLTKQSHVSNLEAGRREPSIELVLLIADLFAVSTDYLLRDQLPVDVDASLASVQQPQRHVLMRHFGAKLQHLRHQRSWTQSDVVKQLVSLTQAYLSLIETGKRSPSLHVVVQLAELFDVPTDYLLRDTIPVASQA